MGSFVEYRWDSPQTIRELRFTFDSDLDRVFRAGERNRGQNMHCCYRPNDAFLHMPEVMMKAFRVEAEQADGEWVTVAQVDNNHQRLLRLPVAVETTTLRFVPEATWGAEQAHVFAWEAR